MQTLSRTQAQQGSILFGVLILMLILSVFAMTGAATIATGQSMTQCSTQATQALYSADAAIEMALKEYIAGSDEDGDGTVGGISDDGNIGNNPTLGQASMEVTFSASVFSATARQGQTTRIVEVTIQ